MVDVIKVNDSSSFVPQSDVKTNFCKNHNDGIIAFFLNLTGGIKI